MNQYSCIFILIFLLSLQQPMVVQCDTWITLWNKLNIPVEIQCFRDSSNNNVKNLKKKIIEPDDRYDIKGKYPQKSSSTTKKTTFYRHWCEVKTEDNISIMFDVFGGKNKKINKMSDSYSDWIINSGGEEHNIEDDLAGTPEKELHPEDFAFIAPVDIDIKTAKMPIDQQRFAITKAEYAALKFENPKDMARYVKAAMKKRFGSFWEVFIEQKMSNKTVKRTCDSKFVMNFSVNELAFIVCQVMR
ncbi:hypothetical protein DERP_015371 [Dermatophagoides pteronyssinus]|uniref:Uncharacterized protein n=1 Tax=Dermatophagoides pteronyssinus TaxID=6956 RepID=A0ABQ8J5P3_DERPT|nr:hypothetical protein DERP_015371 [Dermatophagoides pteronyssinus]